MCGPGLVDGRRGGAQCLGHDLAAEEAFAPGIAGGGADVGVGPVRLERQQLRERDVSDARCGHAANVVGAGAPGGRVRARARFRVVSRTGRAARA